MTDVVDDNADGIVDGILASSLSFLFRKYEPFLLARCGGALRSRRSLGVLWNFSVSDSSVSLEEPVV